MRICAYTECGLPFEPKTHNQRYHHPDCCQKATNAHIMDKYYEKKERRKGKIRVCDTEGCGTQMSRYNDDKICSKCSSAKNTDSRKELLRMFGVSSQP